MVAPHDYSVASKWIDPQLTLSVCFIDPFLHSAFESTNLFTLNHVNQKVCTVHVNKNINRLFNRYVSKSICIMTYVYVYKGIDPYSHTMLAHVFVGLPQRTSSLETRNQSSHRWDLQLVAGWCSASNQCTLTALCAVQDPTYSNYFWCKCNSPDLSTLFLSNMTACLMIDKKLEWWHSFWHGNCIHM